MSIKTVQFKIAGMMCTGCEDIITEAVQTLPGIQTIAVSYKDATATISYDESLTNLPSIHERILGKGYQIVPATETPSKWLSTMKSLMLFLGLMVLVGGVTYWGKNQMPAMMMQIKPHMDHLLLLSIGFLTGFHCVGMCGGFVVGYTDKTLSKLRQIGSHLSYGIGKTFSYAALGAGFGWLGSVIAITPQIRGLAALLASVFVVVYGLKMLNVFSWLRQFTLRMPRAVNQQVAEGLRRHRSPLITGLLTGFLLGCGPLQAMYVMAAGTGNALEGAKMLSLFSIGTLVPLLTFGFFATAIPAAAMRQLVKVSGILVIIMGLMMAQRGWIMLHGQMPMMHSMPMQ